ncbi:MAG TPA: hypothetical protein VGR35_01315 [Tepidisphaeraceae bacterium]|nr:hypothetical protein [Tepidisphaeraceae bacterium]
MDAEPLTTIEYASGTTIRKRRRLRWLAVLFVAVGAYVGPYLVLRAFVEPAVNLAFFVYPGSATVDECCYYGFWPLYKADRFLTGRKHNLDRTHVVYTGL